MAGAGCDDGKSAKGERAFSLEIESVVCGEWKPVGVLQPAKCSASHTECVTMDAGCCQGTVWMLVPQHLMVLLVNFCGQHRNDDDGELF